MLQKMPPIIRTKTSRGGRWIYE